MNQSALCLINHQNMTGKPLPMNPNIIVAIEGAGLIVDLDSGDTYTDPDQEPFVRKLGRWQTIKRHYVASGWAIFESWNNVWTAISPAGEQHHASVLTLLLENLLRRQEQTS